MGRNHESKSESIVAAVTGRNADRLFARSLDEPSNTAGALSDNERQYHQHRIHISVNGFSAGGDGAGKELFSQGSREDWNGCLSSDVAECWMPRFPSPRPCNMDHTSNRRFAFLCLFALPIFLSGCGTYHRHGLDTARAAIFERS